MLNIEKNRGSGYILEEIDNTTPNTESPIADLEFAPDRRRMVCYTASTFKYPYCDYARDDRKKLNPINLRIRFVVEGKEMVLKAPPDLWAAVKGIEAPKRKPTGYHHRLNNYFNVYVDEKGVAQIIDIWPKEGETITGMDGEPSQVIEYNTNFRGDINVTKYSSKIREHELLSILDAIADNPSPSVGDVMSDMFEVKELNKNEVVLEKQT